MKFWKFVFKSLSYSPLRAIEYDRLHNMHLSGRVLDLGGGEKASYLPLFKGDFSVTSLNIDENIRPTIIADITKPFPLNDAEFDFIISFNTFEHIPEFETTFSEASRVLKSGGKFVFSTPFLHQIHGSPNDYWRYSGSALENLLVKNNFKVDKLVPLGSGIFVAQYSLIYIAIPKLIKPFFAFCSRLLDKSLTYCSKRFRKYCTENHYPLGYFVVAEKL